MQTPVSCAGEVYVGVEPRRLRPPGGPRRLRHVPAPQRDVADICQPLGLGAPLHPRELLEGARREQPRGGGASFIGGSAGMA